MKGRDHYNQTYQVELGKEAEWLQRTASNKADSVERLLDRNGIKPKRILELGCGTGAVLTELKRRKVADQYFGVDYSKEAIRYLSQRDPEVRCTVADITNTARPFDDVDCFDVVVLSHVIEHLENPLQFLRAIQRIKFGYLVAEVPLEDLWFGRIKARLKDRRDNPAGHVQFFHPTSFRSLLQKADFDIVSERTYAPVLDPATLRFAYHDQPLHTRGMKLFTERLLPLALQPVWTRLYHGHFAALCKK